MNCFNEQDEINRIIAKSWDDNVALRAKELREATDLSYQNVIVPWVIKNVNNSLYFNNIVLDIGCGCGYLTNLLFLYGCKSIVGIDISKKSIELAKLQYPYIDFFEKNILSFSSQEDIPLCISVMTVNNMPNIDLFFNKISKLLIKGGKMILVLPHPCFWPEKHLVDYSFSYLHERSYSYQFATRTQKGYPSTVVYFHRSLERYFNCIIENGLIIEKISELPEIDNYENPDIIGMVIKKI